MKVIEDILREVDMEVLRQAPHAQRKYNKITESLRLRFLTKIFKENKSIKKAAEELNINYSSAKTILTMHRKKSRSTNDLAALGNNAINNQFGMNPEHQEYTFPSPQAPRSLPPKHLMKPSFMSTASNLSEKQENEDSNSNEHIHNITQQNHHSSDAINNNSTNGRTVFTCNSMNNLSNYPTNPMIPRNYPKQNNLQIPLSASSPNLQQLNNLALLQTMQNQNSIPNNNARNFLNPLPIPQSLSCNNLLQLQQQPQLQQAQKSLPAVLPPQTTAPSSQNILLQIQQQIQAQQQQQQMQNTLQQLILLQSAMLSQQAQQQQQQQQLQQPIIEAANTANASNTSNPLAQLLLQQQLLMLNNKNTQPQPESAFQLPASWI